MVMGRITPRSIVRYREHKLDETGVCILAQEKLLNAFNRSEIMRVR